jgi:hypothetical protein
VAAWAWNRRRKRVELYLPVGLCAAFATLVAIPGRWHHDREPGPPRTRVQRARDQSLMAFPLAGGCDCGTIRYRVATAPLFVHCCHCRWCQRESGSSFALNAMIESDRLVMLAGAPECVDTPTFSGRGQQIFRCPRCRVALWSHYSGAGPVVAFVRVGTLDDPDCLPPDIHIFTASKQPWVILPADTPAVPAYYDREQYWPPESLQRRKAILPQLEAFRRAL